MRSSVIAADADKKSKRLVKRLVVNPERGLGATAASGFIVGTSSLTCFRMAGVSRSGMLLDRSFRMEPVDR
jgi:hypothetical protein